jgi:hypothetical protein
VEDPLSLALVVATVLILAGPFLRSKVDQWRAQES